MARSGEQKVVREAGRSSEFLMQVGILRYTEADGHCQTCIVLRDPLPMTEGKSGWALFAAARAFLPTLRELGHRGLCVEHIVHDRAVLPVLDRRMRQHHTRVRAGMVPGDTLSTNPEAQSLLN